jgi:PAS domain S-box-containing protein
MLNFPSKKKIAFEKLAISLQERLTIATTTLERISEGKFDIHVPGTSNDQDSKAFLNLLNSVKERLSDFANKESERKWIADGTSEFISLTAGDNRERKDFHDLILKFIINYTGANQGGLFLINDDDSDDLFLELISCYAYGRKKHESKRVNIGEGILGQCYLEKQTVRLSDVPQNYTKITSGLGEATPRFLLVIPIQYNGVVQGVIELAYFKKCESYKIEFLEKIAENIASVTINYRNAKKAEALFEESQNKARLLQEKEESLRQNVEELMATQEEMKRNELELDRQAQLLKFIVDNIPFPIFVKDEKSRYTLVNKAESNLFGIPDKELLGKDDSAFVSKSEEWEVIKKSDQKVLDDNLPVELPLQNFTTRNGKSYIFKTTKIPFLNKVTGHKNILGVSVDLTEKLALESQLLFEKTQNQWNTFVNLTGRQRMLSQKIAFYSETLCRGRKHNHALLRDAIELYEHSHQVIRNGGMPMKIRTDHPMPPLREELIPTIKKVETVWSKFKKAAENILYFSTLESGTHLNHTETSESLKFIEENAEVLMELNNEFMLLYMESNRQKNVTGPLAGI